MNDTSLGAVSQPVLTEQATCENCKGMRWVKRYWPPYGTHVRHDAGCQRKYGYCIRLCTVCAAGIKAGQITPQLYTWLGDEAGDLPYKSLATFDRAKQPRGYDIAQEWLAQALANARDLKNVILSGIPGTGKTHLVAALANALQEANIACLFATAPGLFNALYAASFEEKHAFMRRASEIAVLVIDDLDKLHVSAATEGAYQKKTLFEILNKRSIAHKPTLITTNAQDNLKTWFDDATISRLFERMKLITMIGADYRLRKDGMK